jgi:DNA-binding transcriptional regulator YiaG
MTPDEYRKALETLGLTQGGGARLLGVDERTSRRWACGERDIPPPVQRFLRFLIAIGKSGEHVIKLLEA